MSPFHARANDPYATWHPSEATDAPDGLPDRAIVPLVEALRETGVVTLQSCAGHEGTDDGHLWIRADSVTTKTIVRLDRSPFTYIRLQIWPVEQWELGWDPSQLESAIQVLSTLSGP